VNPKHLSTLEFPKVLAHLATYTSFSAGEDKALSLTPATDLQEIRRRLEITSEARKLLEVRPETTLGGAHDIRPMTKTAERGAVLSPSELLDARDTLIAARSLHRTLSRMEDQFPHLAHLASRIQRCPEVIAEINRCLDESGNVRDDASPELSRIRRETRIAHDRIQDKLENIIGSPRHTTYLQEALITQREGRYVIPLKAEFKGRIRGVVHDVSTSGATVFIEPLSVVELNNAWRELQLAERQEVNRILTQLSGVLAEHAAEIEQTVETLAELDLTFAKAQYADVLNATAPSLVPFRPIGKADVAEGAETAPLQVSVDNADVERTPIKDNQAGNHHPGSTMRFIGARHPLLDPQNVVPVNLVLDDTTHVLVITGPNTGGKTVSLKTAGLLTVMTQAGLHIPVEPCDPDGHRSALSPFNAVYADIGDEQSIEQNLSTFSSHLTNIMSFLDQVDQRSLVLLDELGAGTDPAEGSALARALLDHFRLRGAATLVATHYPELKGYAQLTPGVRNACVEFDPETLSPTYELTIGLPGRSNALAIAQRLGLSKEITDEAHQMISPGDLRTQEMLTDIHRLRLQETQARDEAYAARAESENLTRELQERLRAIDQERQEILAHAREEADSELEILRAEVRTLRNRLRAAATPLDAVATVEKAMDELDTTIPEPEPLALPPVPEAPRRPIRPGDTVWVHPLNTKGQVSEITGQEAEVQVGPARTRVRLSALELRAPPPAKPEDDVIHVSAVAPPDVELDLRGCTVEEALGQLDRRLDTALRAGLPWVRVIHGKGTGALRQGVRRFLASHPLVSTYEAGRPNEGGEGITIAKLAI
jgi:DNA mismatch repair protein MutS2